MAVSALCCRVFFEREKRFSRLVPRRVSLASGPVEATRPLLGEGVKLFVIFSAVQGMVDKMSMHSAACRYDGPRTLRAGEPGLMRLLLKTMQP